MKLAVGTAEELPPGPSLPTAQGVDPPRAAPRVGRNEVLLRAARNAVASGDLNQALLRFEELLQQMPEEREARYEYAGLLAQVGRLDDAREQLELLVKAYDTVGEYRMALADLLIRQKQFGPARAALQRLLILPEYQRQAAVKLARSFVWERKLSEAQEVLQQYLGETAGLSAKERRSLAGLLVEMNRPADALRLLEPLRAADPNDEQVLVSMTLAHVRMNQRMQAIQLLTELKSRKLADPGLWLELGQALYREEAHAEALLVLELVARDDPSPRPALLATVRTLLRIYDVTTARALLDQLGGSPDDRTYTTALADYHTVVGEYAEAIAIAQRRLREDPNDLEAAILLGNALNASNQLGAAEAAYAFAFGLTTDDAQRYELRRLRGKNQSQRRAFDEAIGELQQILAERPDDIASRLLLIDVCLKAKRFDLAETLLALPADRGNPRDHFSLRQAQGYLLLDRGSLVEAADQFRALAAEANGHTPDVAYGLYRASQLLNQPEAARAALELGPSPLAPTTLWAAVFAHRAGTYCDCRTSAAVLDDALRCAPQNAVLLNLRGEAAQSCRCGDGFVCPCYVPKLFRAFQAACAPGGPSPATWFEPALATSPKNIRARLGLARVYSRAADFPRSYAEYQTLLTYLPHDMELIRETARVVEAWQGIERAAPIYRQGAATVATQALPQAEAVPVSRGLGTKLLTPGCEEPWIALSGQALTTELTAKSLRGWRFQKALPLYEGLIATEPTNEGAYFDLAQSYSALERTNCAVDAYQRLLCVNPCHTDAQIALNRARLELGPSVITGFADLWQNGRQGLAAINITELNSRERWVLGNENEFIEVGYRERALAPYDGRVDFGEIPFVRWQEWLSSQGGFFGEVDVEKFRYGFATRPTYNVGGELLTQYDGRIRFSSFLNNVYANGESIRQNIYRVGGQLDTSFHPLRLWELSGMYRYSNYSDHNDANEFYLKSAHTLLEGREQLRGLVDYSFTGFARQTVFGPVPGSLVGTVHPYFSPRAFSFATAQLEWKQWFSQDIYKGANEKWYLLQGGLGVDSNSQIYFLSSGRVWYDQYAWLTWSLDAHVMEASVYHEVGVNGLCTIRFP